METPENEQVTTEEMPKPLRFVKSSGEVCRELSFSPQLLAYYKKHSGIPFPTATEQGFDIEECRRWAEKVGVRQHRKLELTPGEREDLAEAKLRLTKAEADLKEAKLAEMNRQLVPISQVQSAWESSLTALRQHILSMTFLKEELRHEILENLSSIPIEEYFKREDGLDADEVDQVKAQGE